MKKQKWLQQDAITRNPLPFDSTRAQLQLLGFFISPEQRYPAALEMAVETAGQRYRTDMRGFAYKLDQRNPYDMRDPDIAASGPVMVGDVAYAFGPNRVVVGPDWVIRRALRDELKAGTLSPAASLAVVDYLQAQPWQVLKDRALSTGGTEAYNAVALWAGLGQRISHATSQAPRPACFMPGQ